MPGREVPVCLTRSPPFDIQSNQLVFYDVVDVSTTAKSGVLSTIADAGGEARLPDAVTLPDFKLWISFVNSKYKNFKHCSFLDLCTAVKVADALDDQDIAQWSYLAAERLVVHASSDPSEFSPDSVDVALSTLTDAAQHRIFSVAASAPRTLYSLLSFLPPHYHKSVVAAAITPEKDLNLPFSRDSIPVIKVLTALPQSPSLVLSLHSRDPDEGPDVSIHMPRVNGRIEVYTERHGFNIAGHLVQALQHHTHLTHLSISSGNIDAASAELLIPAITSLKSLQALHLGDERRPFPAASVTLLQQALPSLCRLQRLKVSLSACPEAGGKRPRESEAAPDPHCCLAAALSPATGLTSLRISIAKAFQRSWYIAATPLELLHLKLLSVAVGINDWALTTAFINRLRADHLTSLEFHYSNEFSAGDQLPDSSVACARQFVDCLAHFSQLCHLTVLLPRDAERVVGGAGDGVMEMMRASAPAVLASLTHLQQLSIAAECPVLCSTVSALAASLTAVTSVALRSVSARRAALIDVPWFEMCTSLCQMNLKRLGVDVWGTDTGTAGLAALRPLTQLSQLHVTGWSCLQTAADCGGLAGMASLRQLSLVECFDDGEPAAALSALLALSALTDLTAGSAREEFNEALVDVMCERDARTVWPGLCVLRLRTTSSRVLPKKVVRWSIGLPALKKLAVAMPLDWIGTMESSEADERRSEDCVDYGSDSCNAFDLDDECDSVFDLKKFYQRIAAEAGVELSRLTPYNSIL